MQPRCNLDATYINLDATQMQLIYKFELRCQLDRLRHSLDSAKILFRLGVSGKIIPRIRLTSAKDLVEVEAELGN